MDIAGLDAAVSTAGIAIGDIADLATQVATSGALRVTELVTDMMFEYTVGVVVVVQSCTS